MRCRLGGISLKPYVKIDNTPARLCYIRFNHVNYQPLPSPPPSLPKYLAEGLPKQNHETLRDIHGYVEELIEEQERAVDKEELPKDAEIVEEESTERGTIVTEMVKCGAGCTCNEGKGHGPYRYRYFREGGQLISEYLGKA